MYGTAQPLNFLIFNLDDLSTDDSEELESSTIILSGLMNTLVPISFVLQS